MKGKIALAALVIATGYMADNARDIQEYFQPELKEARLAEEKAWREKLEASRKAKREAFLNSPEYKAKVAERELKQGKREFAVNCELLARQAAKYGADFDLFRDVHLTTFEEEGETRLHYKTTFNLTNVFGTESKASLTCTGDSKGNVTIAWVNGTVILDLQ